MDALKAIFMANSVESLQAAISEAEATRLVPAEALIVGRSVSSCSRRRRTGRGRGSVAQRGRRG